MVRSADTVRSFRASNMLLAVRAMPFLVHCLRHLIWRTYRQDMPDGGGIRRRLKIAAYDGLMNLLLDGYSELAGHALLPPTGTLIVRLNRLTAALDDEYEDRLASQRPHELTDIFSGSCVHGKLVELADFLQPYPEHLAIRDFLVDRVSRYYDEYVDITAGEWASRDFDVIFRSAVLDSAGLAECLAHVIGLFNGAAPQDGVVEQFASFGIIAKLVDDSIDFWDDLAANRVNVLKAIVNRHPVELSRVVDDADGTRKMTLGWWRSSYPESFAAMNRLMTEYRARVSSSRLRLACDLMLVRAWRGSGVAENEPTAIRA